MIKIEKEDFKKILALADGKEKMFSIEQQITEVITLLTSTRIYSKDVNFQRFPTLDAKKLVNAPKMSAHHRGICHF